LADQRRAPGARLMRGHVETRHQKRCRTHDGGRCNCTPGYRGKVAVPGTRGKERPNSGWQRDRPVAERWVRDALNALDAGVRPSGTGPRTTVAEQVDDLLEGIRDGRILTRSGSATARRPSARTRRRPGSTSSRRSATCSSQRSAAATCRTSSTTCAGTACREAPSTTSSTCCA
jgi:hypothetical protein